MSWEAFDLLLSIVVMVTTFGRGHTVRVKGPQLWLCFIQALRWQTVGIRVTGCCA